MTIAINELVYSPEHGRDMAVNIPIDYNPSAFKTHEEAAKGLATALRKVAVENYGYTPELSESEIVCWPPERTKQYSGEESWCVVWEGGPYDWAIGLSMQIQGPWGHCEPYYGFDLHFTH